MKKIKFGTPSLNKSDKYHLLKSFDSSWISQGPYNQKFENLFKKIHQSKFSLAVVNGTKAIMLALMSLNLKRGDEILVPEYCYISPINICKILGLKIKLVKINKNNLQIELKDLEKKISNTSKCLLLIHNYGNTSDIDKIVKLTKKYNVKILEDFSEALFTKYKNKYAGTFGDISVVSFHATKTITTGEGGGILTNNKNLYFKMVKLREHGFKNRGDYSYENIGSNFKLSNLLASIGYSQLKRFNQIIKNKKIIYKIYNKNFQKLTLVKIPKPSKDQTVCMWAFPLIINDTIVYRKIIKFLSHRKIPFRKGFNFLSNYNYLKISKIKKKFLNVLLLPMNVDLNEKSAQSISLEIKKFILRL